MCGSGVPGQRQVASGKESKVGIMLLGSVPTPPRNPRSCTNTQTATHNTVPTTRAPDISCRRPVSSALPRTASDTTTTRFTAQPCCASNVANELISEDSACGCGVFDMVCAIEVRLPAVACGLACPCQDPRPGHA